MLKKAQHDCPMGRMQFNVTDLEGEVVNGILSIKVPLVTLRGPLISPERMEDLEEAGYEPREVEDAADQMMDGLMARQLGKMLQKRRHNG